MSGRGLWNCLSPLLLDDNRTDGGYMAVQPPSTASTAPVIYEESSEARKSAALATSCGSPVRPRNALLSWRWCNSVPGAGVMRVVIAPGQIALQRILCGPKSQAMLRVNPISPCFIVV